VPPDWGQRAGQPPGPPDPGEPPRGPSPLAPLVIGTPIYEFEPKPHRWLDRAPYRADTVVDGWASRDFLVRAASVRGYSHRWDGIPRQDDFAVTLHRRSGAVLVAVADGVSEAPLSHIGAASACHAATTWLSKALDAGTPVEHISWSDLVTHVALTLVQQWRDEFPEVASPPEQQLATTLVAGVILPAGPQGATACFTCVGDSGIWLHSQGAFSLISGGKASGLDEVADSAVEYPLPSVSPGPPIMRQVNFSRGDVLLVGTDGFGDPLGSGRGEVGRAFSHHLSEPPSPLGLAHLLDFSRETYDDDRTLVAVWLDAPG
jgi:hypothetical protein